MSDIYTASTPEHRRTNPQNPQRFSYQSSAYPEDLNYQPTPQPLTADHTASSNFINPYGEGSSSSVSNNPFLSEEQEEEDEEERTERAYTPGRRNSTSKRPLSPDNGTGTPSVLTRASLPPPKYTEAYSAADLDPSSGIGLGKGKGSRHGDRERLRGGGRPDSMTYSGSGSYTGTSSYGTGSEAMRNGVFLTRLEDLGKNEAVVECPRCGEKGMTSGRFVAGMCTHVTAAVSFLMLCCWIPYVTTFLKDVEHRCGHCGVLLAVWSKGGGGAEVMERKRMSRTQRY